MLVECERCGAPLDAKNADRLVKCRYCETVNKVRDARTLAMETPQGWAPPPVWQPPPQARIQRALAIRDVQITAAERARKSARFVGCMITVTTIIPVGIAMAASFSDSDCSINQPDVDDSPALGVFQAAQLVQGTTLQGSVEASTSASTFASGTGCNAYIETAPTVVLQLASPMFVQLQTLSSSDTTLIVRDAQGRFHCDDDSGGGRNANLGFGAPPGRTGVWVGSFDSGSTTGFQLLMSGRPLAAMPDVLGLVPQGPPAIGTVDLASQPSGQLNGTLSGALDASSLGVGCRGYIQIVPDLILVAAAESPMVIGATSSVDSVLVVRTASGQFLCDDDSGGALSPRVTGTLPAGANAVWVGRSNTSAAPAPFQVSYATTPSGGPMVAGLAPSADPSIRALADADVHGLVVLEGDTTDMVSADQAGPSCRGFVPMAPHARVTLTRQRDSEITTSSNEDLTLVVQMPNGSFACDDDSGGNRQPRVRSRFTAGTSAIWVGRYSQGPPAHFALQVHER